MHPTTQRSIASRWELVITGDAENDCPLTVELVTVAALAGLVAMVNANALSSVRIALQDMISSLIAKKMVLARLITSTHTQSGMLRECQS